MARAKSRKSNLDDHYEHEPSELTTVFDVIVAAQGLGHSLDDLRGEDLLLSFGTTLVRYMSKTRPYPIRQIDMRACV